ncbi:MAG: glutathione S-transferase [Rhizobacter sp.]
MLKVLGKSSSINVRKVLWTCVELGLPFEHEQWGGEFRSTTTPEFTALNPNAMVPVVIDGDVVLWESNTICRYLAHREGRTDLLPADASGRAQVEKWMDWQATELNNSWRTAFMGLVRRSPQHADPAAIDRSVAEFHRHMAMLDAQLSRNGAYVTGDQFTLADVVLGLSTHRWHSLPVERPVLMAVAAYYERLGARPGFQRHGRNGQP